MHFKPVLVTPYLSPPNNKELENHISVGNKLSKWTGQQQQQKEEEEEEGFNWKFNFIKSISILNADLPIHRPKMWINMYKGLSTGCIKNALKIASFEFKTATRRKQDWLEISHLVFSLTGGATLVSVHSDVLDTVCTHDTAHKLTSHSKWDLINASPGVKHAFILAPDRGKSVGDLIVKHWMTKHWLDSHVGYNKIIDHQQA
jgi:hypothetical protein